MYYILSICFNWKSLLLGFVLVCVDCSPVMASEQSSVDDAHSDSLDLLDIWKFSPGIGLRGVTLSVKRKSDGYSGVLTNDDNARDGHISDLYYYSLDIESPAWMLSRYFGVSLRNQTQRIDIFLQKIPPLPPDNFDQVVDLGTSVHGYYSYIGPTLFGVLKERDDFGLKERLGLGFVYWKALFSGDIILAPNNNASANMPHTKISDAIDNSVGPIVYYQWLGERLLFEVTFASVRFSHNGYESTMDEFTAIAGITF